MFTEPREDAGTPSTSRAEDVTGRRARFIRPVTSSSRPALERWKNSGLEEIGSEILREARRRVAGLAQLERELEDRILARWEAAEEEARRRLQRADEDVVQLHRRVEAESKEKSLRLEKEGRAGGFREGFSRGRDEGYRLGLEEGRRDGEREGHESSSRRLEADLAPAIRAFGDAARKLAEESERLIGEAKTGLLALAMEVAKKLVKREILVTDDVVVRNVEHAIDLIFRRGPLVIQVSPEDVQLVEKAVATDPRWTEGFDSIAVRPAPDMDRGGCRLLSGAGVCDMTLATQLGLIEESLARGLHDEVHVVESTEPNRRWEPQP